MSKIYTWPNASFPFRQYYQGGNNRIFIIENIAHNYEWLKVVSTHITPTDYFFVYLGWNFDRHACTHATMVFEELGLNREQFYIMYNCQEEQAWGTKFGFYGDIINHNAWLNENKFSVKQLDKQYDALYIARRTKWKRHYLASGIDNLAMACGGNNHGNQDCEIPVCKNDPEKKLTADEVVDLINKSRCGLSLSEVEGASFGTSEYLLCGIPVVTTPSRGGRSVWLDIDNSIQAQPTVQSVKRSVDEILAKDLNPYIIRDNHIRLANVYRKKFINQLGVVFDKFGLSIDPEQFYKENYFHKMRNSNKINNVIEIFTQR